MKFQFALLAIAFTVSSIGVSQELWLNETDDFTGVSKKATRAEKVGDNQAEKKYAVISINLSTIRVGDSWGFRLGADSDLGCAGASGNYCMLKFSDGEVIQLEDGAKIDCADMSTSLYSVTDELMARIDSADAPVMIRLKQADYYTDAKVVDAAVWNAHCEAIR